MKQMTLWNRFFLEFAKAIVPQGYEVTRCRIGGRLFTESIMESERIDVADLKFSDDR